MIERFMGFVQPEPNTGCWLWAGSVSDGYGTIGAYGRTKRAHRLSWELHNGPIPDGLHVLHRCDVRCCVNPDHLMVGTNADNVRDRDTKNRQARGVGHGIAKLTPPLVFEILYWTESVASLIRRLGVGSSTIYRVRARESWYHLTLRRLPPGRPQ